MSVVGSCFSFDVALVGARGSGKTAFAEAWGSLLALDGYVRRADGTTPVLGATPYEETAFTRVHHLSVVVPDCEAASAHRLFLHDTPGSLVRRGVAEGLLTRRTVSRRLNGAVLLVDGRPGATAAAAAEQRDGAVHFLRLAALHNVPLLVIHRGGPVPTSLMREGAEAAFVACAHDDLFEPTRALVSFVQQLHGICVTAQHVERSRVLAQAEARLHQRRMPPLLAPRRGQPYVCLPHHVPIAAASSDPPNLTATAAALTVSPDTNTPSVSATKDKETRITHVYVGLFGSAACGKSAFLSALVDGSTLTHYEPTLQLTLGTCAFVFGDGTRCNVTLLDGPPNAIAKYLAKRQQRARDAVIGLRESKTGEAPPPSRPGSRHHVALPLTESATADDGDGAGNDIADADASGHIHTVGIFFVDASSLAGLAEADACHREMLSVFHSPAAPNTSTNRTGGGGGGGGGGADEADSANGRPGGGMGGKGGSSISMPNSPDAVAATRRRSHTASGLGLGSGSYVTAWGADLTSCPRVVGADREFSLAPKDPEMPSEGQATATLPPVITASAATPAEGAVPLPPLVPVSRLVSLSSEAFRRARAEALAARRRVVSPELEPPARPTVVEPSPLDETANEKTPKFLPTTLRHTFHHMASPRVPGATLDALLPPLHAKAAVPRCSSSLQSSTSHHPTQSPTPPPPALLPSSFPAGPVSSSLTPKAKHSSGARERLAAALSCSVKLQAARAARQVASGASAGGAGGGDGGVEHLVATMVRHLAAVAEAPPPGARSAQGAGRPELPGFMCVAVTKENVDDFLNRPDVMAWTADVCARYAGSVDPRASNAQLVFSIVAEYLEAARASAARRRREAYTGVVAAGHQATINELLEEALLSGSVATACGSTALAGTSLTDADPCDVAATTTAQSTQLSRALRATFARADRHGRGFISREDAVALVRDCDRAGVFDAAAELEQATRRAPSSVNAHGAVTEDQFCATLCGMIARA